MATVKWTLGTTVNIGNFSNIRMEVSVTDDARPGESVKDASDRVFEFVDSQLGNKLEETRRELEESVEAVTRAATR